MVGYLRGIASPLPLPSAASLLEVACLWELGLAHAVAQVRLAY